MTIKIKDKKIIYTKLYFRQLKKIEKLENLNYRGLFVNKGSGSGIFPDQYPDLGDPKRLDPDP